MARWRLVVLTALTAIAFAACGGSIQGAGQQAPATTVAAAPSATPRIAPYPDVVMPESLRGTWIANVQRPGPSNGIWRLRVSEHGMELKNPAAGSDEDFFWVMTDRIDGTSFHIAHDADCPELTFSWKVTGDELVMTTSRPQPTTTDDLCGDPVVTLTTPFKRDS
jgi:hypothetical protein